MVQLAAQPQVHFEGSILDSNTQSRSYICLRWTAVPSASTFVITTQI